MLTLTDITFPKGLAAYMIGPLLPVLAGGPKDEPRAIRLEVTRQDNDLKRSTLKFSATDRYVLAEHSISAYVSWGTYDQYVMEDGVVDTTEKENPESQWHWTTVIPHELAKMLCKAHGRRRDIPAVWRLSLNANTDRMELWDDSDPDTSDLGPMAHSDILGPAYRVIAGLKGIDHFTHGQTARTTPVVSVTARTMKVIGEMARKTGADNIALTRFNTGTASTTRPLEVLFLDKSGRPLEGAEGAELRVIASTSRIAQDTVDVLTTEMGGYGKDIEPWSLGY